MNFKEEMYKKYSHAEVDDNTAQTTVFYTEQSVVELMKLVRDKTIEWAKSQGRVVVGEEFDEEDRDRASHYIDYMEVKLPSEETKIFKKFLEI